LHHLVKHSFVPAILEQAARLPGLTHKDLERAGAKRPSASMLANHLRREFRKVHFGMAGIRP
ncbi:hypothetical protein, partial [Paraburkholderia silvatlantica]|uniref:hypothetical protein n=1 Tax=Paraburkholderia silvatlantica TaxID=321895 RepID=UPI001A9C7C6E